MSGTFPVVMGDRGRLVVPAELRERLHLSPGTRLLLVETPSGVAMLTRDQARSLVSHGLADVDPVGELLAERRAQARADDAA